MELTVTQEHLDAARAAGACNELPAIGAPLEALGQSDVIWFCDHCPHLVPDTPIPIWAMTDAGYGHGDGSGYGDGDGYGYGD